MRYRFAETIAEHSIIRTAEKGRGYSRVYMRMSAFRAQEINVAESTRLPVRPGAAELQDAGGNFYMMANYSKLDGTDRAL